MYLCAVCVLFVFADNSAATAEDVSANISSDINTDTASITTDTTNIIADINADTVITVKANKNELTDTVFYESDFIDYDNEERVLKLYGHAQVKYFFFNDTATTEIYTVSNDQFQARGTPQLVEGSDTTVGDFMVYNIKTRRGRVSYAVTRFDETLVTGSNVVKTPDNCFYIEQGDYTTCENPDHPHYFFYGRHIKMIPQETIITRPVVLNVGDAPIAILPYFIMPLQKGRRSGWLTPSWGGSFNRGGYIDNLGYYFAPNDYYDAALSAKVQEFNSFVFNASGRYNLRYMLDGQISGRYVVDNRLENSSHQWALDYRHNQFLTPDGKTRLSGRGNIISNRTFNQMYSDQTHELERQQLDANMALTHRFDKINASTNITWRRNHNLTTDRIIEDMPSADFNLQNRAFLPFKPGGTQSDPSWYNNVYYSYNAKANVRRDAYGNDSIPGFIRPGMTHNANVSSSQKILKYVDISPFFNARSSMFYGAIDTLTGDTLNYEFNAVNSWNTGVNTSTRIYGLFPIGLMGVTAIRHTMTPTVGYSYTPKHELDRKFYNVGISYDSPREKAQQAVNFSLSNQFQGKRTVRKTDKSGRDNRTKPGETGSMMNDLKDDISNVGGAVSVIEEKVSEDEHDDIENAELTDGNDGNDEPDKDSELDDKKQDRSTSARAEEQKFDILTFSLNTSYNFEAEERKWRDLALSAHTNVSFLNVSFSSNFWLYDELNELVAPIMRDYNFNLTSGRLGASGNFWDGNLINLDVTKPGDITAQNKIASQRWDVSFSPSFSYRATRLGPQDMFLPTKSFNLSSSANMNLTSAMSVRWNGNYDFSSNQFSHNNYTFHYDLECWEMRFTWRPEKINPGFHFVVRIKKLPDIKWEEKESKTTRVL
jgi:lipopolysaccharide assembly outer membrane protein LptD (OstA)